MEKWKHRSQILYWKCQIYMLKVKQALNMSHRHLEECSLSSTRRIFIYKITYSNLKWCLLPVCVLVKLTPFLNLFILYLHLYYISTIFIFHHNPSRNCFASHIYLVYSFLHQFVCSIFSVSIVALQTIHNIVLVFSCRLLMKTFCQHQCHEKVNCYGRDSHELRVVLCW